MAMEHLPDVVQEFQYGGRSDLKSKLRDIPNHLLVHHPVAFFDPRAQFTHREELLNGYGESAVKGGEEFEELLLFAEADGVDERSTMGPIESNESVGSILVVLGGKIRAGIENTLHP